MISRLRPIMSMALSGLLVLAACSKNDGSAASNTSSNNTTTSTAPASTVTTNNSGSLYNAPASQSLSVSDVQTIIAQAVAEANAQGKPATLAVVDRVGNVLAVYTMAGAPALASIPSAPVPANNTDLEGLNVPSAGAAIAKAITGAYLSSGGNAFSTRTANEIVQPNFPPGPAFVKQDSGPLFGVQISQLPCSDLVSRYIPAGGAAAMIGPKRSPLGLAADFGGFPLYKNSVLVGGVGVLADGVYGFDSNVADTTYDVDENIAFAATNGYAAPSSITADKIELNGTQLAYSNATTATIKSNPAAAPAFSTTATVGSLTPVIGYFAGAIIPGVVYGTEASGIRPATTAEFNNVDAFVLSNGSGTNRYQAIGGSDAADVGTALTPAEVTAVLQEAFKVMSDTRAAIRQPLNSRAQVTMSVVDTHGKILGMVRSPDAPIFGIDVALQKARTAAFFSSKSAASDLTGNPSADVRSFVAATRTFLGNSTALTGGTAFTDRAIGNISQPFFPSGINGNPNGPLSRPIAQWSPFSTGLQTALVLTNLGQHLAFVTGASATDTPVRCTFLPDATAGQNRLQNGMQIFAGSSPIYRGNTLVGAIGTSGDGIDQDDMISFLGLYNGGQDTNTLGEAPTAIRSDQINIQVAGQPVNLRYVNCPTGPFLDNNNQTPCSGK
jgi:uncharacterized protein GlcG (DUF336 family)